MRGFNEPLEQECQWCHKSLFGRTDKRFCNDDCRNAFNRNKRKKAILAIPEGEKIIKSLRKNYEILYRLSAGRELPFRISRHELIVQGFHFKFHTASNLVTRENRMDLYHYCFDLGWL